jgi:phage terminase Nu1 subunit (DNA packaging protein)/phage terminase small subunit
VSAFPAPDWMSPAAREYFDGAALGLGRPVRGAIDGALLVAFAQAQERYETAAQRQAAIDKGNAMPLLMKQGSRAGASPYLAIMDKASAEMARIAASLGLRTMPAGAGYGIGTSFADDDPAGFAADPLAIPAQPEDDEAGADPADIGSVSKRELCLILRISRPTLDNWISRYGADFPILAHGNKGRDYRFDPVAVTEFLRQKKSENEAKKAERDEQLSQLLLPLPDAPATAEGMSLDDRLKAERLNVIRIENARRAGALVSVAEIEAETMAFLAALSGNLQAWARQFGRQRGWSEIMVREAQHSLAQLQRTTAAEHLDPVQPEIATEDQLAFG